MGTFWPWTSSQIASLLYLCPFSRNTDTPPLHHCPSPSCVLATASLIIKEIIPFHGRVNHTISDSSNLFLLLFHWALKDLKTSIYTFPLPTLYKSLPNSAQNLGSDFFISRAAETTLLELKVDLVTMTFLYNLQQPLLRMLPFTTK